MLLQSLAKFLTLLLWQNSQANSQTEDIIAGLPQPEQKTSSQTHGTAAK
jgi:hypothetical protein